MEVLRFGSSIPGAYWGCCAMDIIQNFHLSPTAKASIQLVGGDGGQPSYTANGQVAFLGMTNEDIFRQRLRIGTFDTRDMPNHGFIAILTQSQISGSVGKAWLKILKETGFEFIRTVSNSVYTGQSLGASDDDARNYVFALFRNIGAGNTKDPFTPPKAWTDLDAVVPELWSYVPDSARAELADDQRTKQLECWNALPEKKFYTEKELEAAKVPVIYAGKRSAFPPQPKEVRAAIEGASAAPAKPPKTATAMVKGCGAGASLLPEPEPAAKAA
jgi:hypothetical protein